jgi:hypothetical protein
MYKHDHGRFNVLCLWWCGGGVVQLYDRFGLVEEQVALAHKVPLAPSFL